MNPEISVVLPAYNAAETLASTLESLIAQTFLSWETLVIDDGSEDATSQVATEFAQRDPRIRLLGRPHLGLVPALNFGLSQAKGKIIARHDADDRSRPERLAKQYQFLNNQRDIDLVSCLVEHEAEGAWEQPGKDTRGYASYCEWLNTVVTPDQIRLASFVESPLAHPTVMFRRECFEKFGDYANGPFPEDYELWLRWLASGVRMAKVPEPLYVWTDRPSRLSRTDERYNVDAFHLLKSRSIASWLEGRSPSYPDVIVWGAGQTSRRRAAFLEQHGCRITCYIDVDEKRRGQKIDGRPVYLMDEFERLPNKQ